MPLGTTEQVIYSYIVSNENIHDFWINQIQKIKASEPDFYKGAKELEERLMEIYVGGQDSLKEIEVLVDLIDAMTCNWLAIAYSLMGVDLETEIRNEVAALAMPKKGTKENPIPIMSLSYTGVSFRVGKTLDEIYGSGNWQSPINYGDIHGLRCWQIRLPDGTQEAVWFDYSPSAEAIAKMESDDKLGINQEWQKGRHAFLQKATELLRANQVKEKIFQNLREELKKGNADKRPEHEEKDGINTSIGCLGLICVIYMVIVSNEMWLRIAYLIGGSLVLGLISSIVAPIERKLRTPNKPLPTPREHLEMEIDNAYNEYKRINPDGSLSRDIIRSDWLKRHDFPENF